MCNKYADQRAHDVTWMTADEREALDIRRRLKGTHEPYITVGRRWGRHPACSCGWIGPHCDDEGEAIRKAHTHIRHIRQAEES